MKGGDISNEAPAIGVDYNSVFDYTPRSRLDEFFNKISAGRWAAFAPLDVPKPNVKYVLSSMRSAQQINIFYTIFAPEDKYAHLETTAMHVLNKHDIPAHGVYVLPDKNELLQWIKENKIIAYFTMDWSLISKAGLVGKGINSWRELMVE